MEASDVNVKIVTTQTADGESETFCTETDGTLYRRDDSGFSLAYTEPDEERPADRTARKRPVLEIVLAFHILIGHGISFFC